MNIKRISFRVLIGLAVSGLMTTSAVRAQGLFPVTWGSLPEQQGTVVEGPTLTISGLDDAEPGDTIGLTGLASVCSGCTEELYWETLIGSFSAGSSAQSVAWTAPSVSAQTDVLILCTVSDGSGGVARAEHIVTVTPAGAILHSVCGWVSDGGVGLPSVQIGGFNGSVVTAADGTYCGEVIDGWSGQITPDRSGFDFDPPFRSYTNVTAGLTGQDFSTEPVVPKVRGTVVDSGGVPVEGVRIGGLPWLVWTNSSGEYRVPVDSGWSGVVDPFKAGYTFAPDSISLSGVTSDVRADFTGSVKTYQIGGRIRHSGSGLVGVSLVGLPGSPTTNSAGDYIATVPWHFSGTVTPTMAGFTFNPPSREYDRVGMSRLDEAYTATQVPVSVSGRVTIDGAGLGSVLINGLIGAVTTASNGTYSGLVPYGFSGELTPSRSGYTFSPMSLAVGPVTTPVVDRDFVASPLAPETGELFVVSTSQELNQAMIWSQDGDYILVKAGTYTGISFNVDNNWNMVSEDGPDQTIIEMSSDIRVNMDNVVIDGFTFVKTGTNNAMIDIWGGSQVELRNCILSSTATSGDLIRLKAADNVLVTQCQFNRVAASNGTAVLLDSSTNGGTATFRNNSFTGFSTAISDGYDQSMTLVLENNRFEDNTTAGVDVGNLGSIVVTNCIFEGNGTGIEISQISGTVEMSQNVFYGNNTGADVNSSTATFFNNIFQTNTRGIDTGSTAVVSVHHHMFQQNGMWYGPGTFNRDWATIWEVDPQLEDPANADFHLVNPGSPALGVGQGGHDLGAYGGSSGGSWVNPPSDPEVPPQYTGFYVAGNEVVTPGSSLRLVARGLYTRGFWSDHSDRCTWSSSDPVILASTGGGLYDANVPGVATATAVQDAETATLDVNVVAGDIEVSLVGTPNPVEAGAPLRLTIGYANTGSGTASNVQLAASYAAGLTYVSALPSPDPGTIDTWTQTDIEPGENGTITVNLVVSPSQVGGTTLQSSLDATWDWGPGASTVGDVSVAGDPDLAVTIESGVGIGSPGQQIDLTAVVENTGWGHATAVTLEGYPGEGLIFDWSDPPPSAPGQWTIGPLAPGEFEIVVIRVTVEPSASDSVSYLASVSTVEDDVNSSNDTAMVTVDIGVPVLFSDGFESGGVTSWTASIP